MKHEFRWKTAVLGLFLMLSTACTTLYRNHGYVPPEEELQNIVVGAVLVLAVWIDIVYRRRLGGK